MRKINEVGTACQDVGPELEILFVVARAQERLLVERAARGLPADPRSQRNLENLRERLVGAELAEASAKA